MKYYKFFLIIVFLGNTFNSISQEWESIFQPKSSNIVQLTDSEYNTYNENYIITGYFRDSLVFSTHDSLLSTGLSATFLSSLNSNLEPLWIYKIDGEGQELRSTFNTDEQGNIYITGMFTEACNFGNDTILSSDGIGDIYLAKFNSQGHLLWINHIGRGESFQTYGNILIDNNDDIIFSMDYKDSVIISDNRKDTILFSGPSTSDGSVIMKIDSSGVIYENSIYNIQSKGDNGATNIYGIKEYNGSYYFSGRFQDSVFFESGSYESTNSSYDNFLLKTDTDLNDLWVRRTYGSSDDYPGSTTSDQ
ncbi:MAG: hypothetical protein R6U04_00210, partial [Bacteroidales bacterium]